MLPGFSGKHLLLVQTLLLLQNFHNRNIQGTNTCTYRSMTPFLPGPMSRDPLHSASTACSEFRRLLHLPEKSSGADHPQYWMLFHCRIVCKRTKPDERTYIISIIPNPAIGRRLLEAGLRICTNKPSLYACGIRSFQAGIPSISRNGSVMSDPARQEDTFMQRNTHRMT